MAVDPSRMKDLVKVAKKRAPAEQRGLLRDAAKTSAAGPKPRASLGANDDKPAAKPLLRPRGPGKDTAKPRRTAKTLTAELVERADGAPGEEKRQARAVKPPAKTRRPK